MMLASLILIAPVHAATPAQASKPVILVVGDSLSAGYGVAVDATWVALLERKLTREGYGYRVVNASISGDTTGGALNRLPRALELRDAAAKVHRRTSSPCFLRSRQKARSLC